VRVIEAAELHEALDYPSLIEALRRAFRDGCELPVRHHHTIGVPGAPDATLLLMPAWRSGEAVGVKIVSVFPGNAARGLPAVAGLYLLLDGDTGMPRALLDGQALTVRRTAAASALAASYLARPDAERLVMVGTGALVPHLIAAHAEVRPIREVAVWGRSLAKAEAVAKRFAVAGFTVSAVTDLAEAVRRADVVSCATLSSAPLIDGAWLPPGVHLDLVGGFTPAMREANDEAVRRARVYVDTREGACKEAGDIVQPLASGVLAPDAIAGDLFELTRDLRPGRRAATEITLFKSVGTALEDFAAARLAVERLPPAPE
jgi:ornithine cyclodeaminase